MAPEGEKGRIYSMQEMGEGEEHVLELIQRDGSNPGYLVRTLFALLVSSFHTNSSQCSLKLKINKSFSQLR